MFVDVALALDALGEGEARLGPEWIEHGGERVLGALESARADRRERGVLSRKGGGVTGRRERQEKTGAGGCVVVVRVALWNERFTGPPG
jgi:hypothetical protein